MDDSTANGGGEFLAKLLWLVNNPQLENKAWFRFVRVLQGIAMLSVVLVACLTAYITVQGKTLTSATLKCSDGTSWNAIDKESSYRSYKSEISMYDMCGLCTNRLPNDKYVKCDIGTKSNKLFDSYTVDRVYKRDNSNLAVVGYTTVVLFIGWFGVNMIARALIYIIGGGHKE